MLELGLKNFFKWGEVCTTFNWIIDSQIEPKVQESKVYVTYFCLLFTSKGVYFLGHDCYFVIMSESFLGVHLIGLRTIRHDDIGAWSVIS